LQADFPVAMPSLGPRHSITLAASLYSERDEDVTAREATDNSEGGCREADDRLRQPIAAL
jgi:hypothetical protein